MNGNRVAALSQLRATLLPSPMKTTRAPSIEPRCSTTVRMSPSTWHGCRRSVSPFTTGTVAFAASSSTRLCLNVRIMIASTYRDSTCPTSFGASRLSSPISRSVMKRLVPPSWRIATSKLSRVRRLGLWKMQASTRPGWLAGRRNDRASGFCAAATRRIASSSSREKSRSDRKSFLPSFIRAPSQRMYRARSSSATTRSSAFRTTAPVMLIRFMESFGNS